MNVDELLAERFAEGYEIVREGKIVVPWNPDAKPKLTLSERMERPDDALSIRSGDVVLDDDERWLLLRKPKP